MFCVSVCVLNVLCVVSACSRCMRRGVCTVSGACVCGACGVCHCVQVCVRLWVSVFVFCVCGVVMCFVVLLFMSCACVCRVMWCGPNGETNCMIAMPVQIPTCLITLKATGCGMRQDQVLLFRHTSKSPPPHTTQAFRISVIEHQCRPQRAHVTCVLSTTQAFKIIDVERAGSGAAKRPRERRFACLAAARAYAEKIQHSASCTEQPKEEVKQYYAPQGADDGLGGTWTPCSKW